MSRIEKEIKVFIYRTVDDLKTNQVKGAYQQYTIPFVERMTVLDVLNYIYEHYDKTLSYYYSCRIGKCNGCIVNINGKNRQACTTLAKDGIKIGPVKNRQVIKDLLVKFTEKE